MLATRKFTVIVPTRNRADTLQHTLRTCVMQDYDNLEILVSDNCSDDGTAEVVAAVQDPRVRRIQTERRLGMSQNWEFALGHVGDGMVLIVGDDDALLPNAIQDIARILSETGCEGIAWKESKYYWPDCGGGAPANTLRMSLRSGWRVVSAKEALDKVTRYEAAYTTLPSLYWGVLSRDAIRRATGATGAFFQSLNPDVYSALATTMVLDRYVWSERSYRLNGMSRHSTGISFAAVEKTKESPRTQFLTEGNLPFHPSYVLVPASPLYVAEAYQQAREHVPGGASYPAIPLATVLDQALRSASADRADVYDQVAEAVREMARLAGTPELAEGLIPSHPHREAPPPRTATGISLRTMTMKVDCNHFAIRDVAGAAVLCHTISSLLEHDYFSPKGIAKRVIADVRGRISRLSRR